MGGGRYLLDTNVAILVLNGAIDLAARRQRGFEAFLCLPVVGELLFGAERSTRPEANRARVQQLLERCPLVPLNLATARLYAAIKAQLRSVGRPIPENDLWIAALARQHQLILATRDGHFEAIEDLPLEAW